MILLINSVFILCINFKNKNFQFNFININKFLMSILLILTIGLIFKNLIRINKNFHNQYVDYPWPKMNSFTEENYKNTNIAVYSENKKFLYFKPYPYSLCMSSSSPCTSNNSVKDINIKMKYGYKIYYYKN